MNKSELQQQVFDYFHGTNGVGRNVLKAIELCKKISDGDIYRLYEIGKMYLSVGDVQNAIEYHKKGAELGDTWAMVKIGLIYKFGLHVSCDFEISKYWYKLAADAGNSKAIYQLGLIFHQLNDSANAKKFFEMAYNAGVAAGAYEIGENFSKNNSEAIEWYDKFANAEIFPSFFDDKLQHKIKVENYCAGKNIFLNYYEISSSKNSGLRFGNLLEYYREKIFSEYAHMIEKMSWFYFSSDDKKNIDKIIKYLTRTANLYNNHSSSVNERLGQFYERQKNFDSAIYWYKRSLADKNNFGMTLEKLGKVYCKIGDGFNAAKCFEDAYNEKYFTCAFELGKIYQQGKIISQNAEKAVEWYEKFVRMTDTPYLLRVEIGSAFTRLGEIFLFGQGTKINYAKALEYFLKAIKIFKVTEVCDGYAYFYLGKIYYFGLGVEKNFEKAFENLKESVAWHNPEAIRMLADVYLKNKNSAENPEEFIKLLEGKKDFETIGRLCRGVSPDANPNGMLKDNPDFFGNNPAPSAKKYLIKSAENGNMESAWLLGGEWYKKVFENYKKLLPTDDIKILHRLAMMYDEYGIAVECDAEKKKEFVEKWSDLFPEECFVDERSWNGIDKS